MIVQYGSDGSILKQLNAPKSVNLRHLLERLICRDLDDDAIVASSLRSSDKRYYDPFQIIDMQEEHRSEQARAALSADPDTEDPIGLYNRARAKPIPLGKILMIAGAQREFFAKEVEVVRGAK